MTSGCDATRNPPHFYNQQVQRGQEGLAWEKKVGMTYEEWLHLPEDQKGEERLPPEWPLLWLGSDKCKLGVEDGVPVMCKQQACAKCFAAQKVRRAFLRNVALWGKDWLELGLKTRQDYIRQWVVNNPLSDDPSLVALCGQVRDPLFACTSRGCDAAALASGHRWTRTDKCVLC